jgi:hypothetical protein
MNDQELSQKEREVDALQVEYSRKIEDVIKALVYLWESSLAMRDLFTEADAICKEYEIEKNPIRFSSLSINNLTLFSSAHLFLRKMEETFPDICKDVKHPTYESRYERIYSHTHD